MRIFKPLLLLFILVCVEHKALFAQADFVEDAAIWVNFYLEKKVNKHWDIHLNQQNRFDENATQYRMGYADVGFTYRFNKHFKILGDYVIAERKILDGTYSTRHQFYTAFVAQKKWKRWKLSYRNMVQFQVQDVYSSQDGSVPVFYERNKVTTKYYLNKRFTVYGAQEIYYPLYQAKNKGFDRSRTFGGLFYNLSKDTKIEFYYMYQHQLNAFSQTKNFHIYGFGFEHNF